MKHPEIRHDGALLGGRIREARKNAGLSQQALADRLGVSRNTVVNWETGRCKTDYQTALDLCGLLGLSPAELSAPGADTELTGSAPDTGRAQACPPGAVSGLHPQASPDGLSAMTLTGAEAHLLQLYRQLSPAARRHGEELLSALLDGEAAAPARPGRPASSREADSAGRSARNSAAGPASGIPVRPAVDGTLFRLFADYPGAASAGTGTEFADTRPEPLILRRSERNERADAVVRVSGDSMEPVYHDGDMLYFRFTDTARSGADVVCSTIHGAIVKRMGRDGLFSVNPARPFRMKTEADNVRLIGVVTGIASPEDWPSYQEQAVLSETFHDEEKDFRRKYRLEDWD